jgi:hypothetical protein
MVREFGFAVGDVMKLEPPGRPVPLFAFQLGVALVPLRHKPEYIEEVFYTAGCYAAYLLTLTLGPSGLPGGNAEFADAFIEGVRGRVDGE